MYPYPRIWCVPFDQQARARIAQQPAFVSLSVLLASLYAVSDVTLQALLDTLNAEGFSDEEISAALGLAEPNRDGTYACVTGQ